MSRGPEVGELNQVPVPYLICPQLQSLLPESLARSLLPGTGCQKQLLAAQVQLQSGTAELQAELLQSQALLADLQAQVRGQGPPAVMGACHCEGSLRNPPPVLHAVPLTVFQVRKLELERAQHKLLLESLQQRHQADLELIENAHRYALPCLWPPGLPEAPGLPRPTCSEGPHPRLGLLLAGAASRCWKPRTSSEKSGCAGRTRRCPASTCRSARRPSRPAPSSRPSTSGTWRPPCRRRTRRWSGSGSCSGEDVRASGGPEPRDSHESLSPDSAVFELGPDSFLPFWVRPQAEHTDPRPPQGQRACPQGPRAHWLFRQGPEQQRRGLTQLRSACSPAGLSSPATGPTSRTVCAVSLWVGLAAVLR